MVGRSGVPFGIYRSSSSSAFDKLSPAGESEVAVPQPLAWGIVGSHATPYDARLSLRRHFESKRSSILSSSFLLHPPSFIIYHGHRLPR
jgi:hypothetical protein